MLDEAVLCDEVVKGVLCDKVVVDAVRLAGPRAAGGVGDGEGKGVWVALEEELVEGALADARGAGDDDWSAVGGEDCCVFWELLVFCEAYASPPSPLSWTGLGEGERLE